MAAGVAVIAADAGGPAEVVTGGVDGLLVPMSDVAGLTAAIARLADDPQLRTRIAAAGKARSAHFDPEKVATGVLEAYARLSTKTSRRRRVTRHPAGVS